MWTKITEDKATWPPMGDDAVVILCTRRRLVVSGLCEERDGRVVSWAHDASGTAAYYIGDSATHWMPLPPPPEER